MQDFEKAQPVLELGMQELEAMDAPGWWTVVGISAGVIVSASAAYGSAAVSIAVT
ncbi:MULTISPECIES: daptide-type RiPP [unclassified Streptomyces]|uniref:daptide-type RiPP n=1 Tax=unclassified Streptomyces TaxID=2593676 RepID=UPI001660F5BC|nr:MULTISPECIES: daptide-type RiPP [unclassified Streptomyces]